MDAVKTKACVKCGSLERNKSKACGPCIRANSKAWYEKNKEKHIANTSARRSADLPKYAKAQAVRRAKNPELSRQKERDWYAKNIEKIAETKSAWRSKNPESVAKSSRLWASKNKEAVRIQSHNRRAKIMQVGGRLTKGLSQKLFVLQKGKCPCCSMPLRESFHMDHITPLASNGANEDSNIQLLCQKCNSKKSDIDPIKYMQKLGFLI